MKNMYSWMLRTRMLLIWRICIHECYEWKNMYMNATNKNPTNSATPTTFYFCFYFGSYFSGAWHTKPMPNLRIGCSLVCCVCGSCCALSSSRPSLLATTKYWTGEFTTLFNHLSVHRWTYHIIQPSIHQQLNIPHITGSSIHPQRDIPHFSTIYPSLLEHLSVHGWTLHNIAPSIYPQVTIRSVTKIKRRITTPFTPTPAPATIPPTHTTTTNTTYEYNENYEYYCYDITDTNTNTTATTGVLRIPLNTRSRGGEGDVPGTWTRSRRREGTGTRSRRREARHWNKIQEKRG
jgi:hypothetical protein